MPNSVFSAVQSVAEEIGRLSANQEVTTIFGRSYSVVGIDQIVSVLQPLLLKNQLTVYPQVREYKSWDAPGNEFRLRPTHFSQVLVDYVVVGPDGSSFTATVVGEAESDTDKSMAAAMSFAAKYFFKQVFWIVTGDPDPDVVGASMGQGAAQPPQQQTQQQSRPQPASQQQSSTVQTPHPVQQPRPQSNGGLAQKISNTAGSNAPTGEALSEPQTRTIYAITQKTLQWDEDATIEWLSAEAGRPIQNINGTGLTKAEATKIINKLKKLTGQ